MQIKHRFYLKLLVYGIATAILAEWYLLGSGSVALVELGAQVWETIRNRAWLAVPMIVLLAPGLVVLLLRRQILRMQDERLAGIGYRYFQILNGLTVTIWLSWIGLSLTAESGHLLNSALGTEQTLWRASLELGLVVIPPIGAIASCYHLSYPVLVRLGNQLWTQDEWLRQIIWNQVRAFVPLVLFFGGARCVFMQQFGLAVVLLTTACLSQILLTEWTEQTNRQPPPALTTGELRDRIFTLAERAGVSLKQIYLLPSSKGQAANAFAIQGGYLMLTTNLLHHLNQRELDAIVAHELAHLQYHHPQVLQAILMVVMVAIMTGAAVAATWGFSLLLTPVVGIALLWFYYTCARRFEYAADRQAARLSQDPAALMTGLVKLAHLNHTPLDWGEWGLLTTHPSIQQRLDALAHHCHISPNQIQRILASLN